MKGTSVVLDAVDGRAAAALLKDGVVEDLLIDAAPGHMRPGAIIRAIAQRPMKGQGGLFVDLGGGATGFLRQWKGIAPGQAVLVQVNGFATEGKAIPVTTRLAIRGRFVIITPGAPGRNVSKSIGDETRIRELTQIAAELDLNPDIGMIVRTRADGANPDQVTREMGELAKVANAIWAEKDVATAEVLLDGPDPHEVSFVDWPTPDAIEARDGAFDDLGILDAIDTFRATGIQLSGGGRMTIEPTAALIAVDVDTGGQTNPAAALSTNIEAARALPRELRCRGLGGQITIDFAPSPKRDRHRIEQSLKAAFRRDPDESVLAGWTPLGLFEIQRKRSRLPISEILP
jgi:Ribonuclease G/E